LGSRNKPRSQGVHRAKKEATGGVVGKVPTVWRKRNDGSSCISELLAFRNFIFETNQRTRLGSRRRFQHPRCRRRCDNGSSNPRQTPTQFCSLDRLYGSGGWSWYTRIGDDFLEFDADIADCLPAPFSIFFETPTDRFLESWMEHRFKPDVIGLSRQN